MRAWGEIAGIHYKRKGFCVRHLANEYTLTRPGYWSEPVTVYVDDIAGLRAAIAHYAGESEDATGE